MVTISAHAVERFCERVRPGLTPDRARVELEHLIDTFGERGGSPPAWTNEKYPAGDYIVLGASICLPVCGGHHVTTCLTRRRTRRLV